MIVVTLQDKGNQFVIHFDQIVEIQNIENEGARIIYEDGDSHLIVNVRETIEELFEQVERK